MGHCGEAGWLALVALAGGTGLRWSERAGLCWDALDLTAGMVRVVRVAEEFLATSRSSPIRSPVRGAAPCRDLLLGRLGESAGSPGPSLR